MRFSLEFQHQLIRLQQCRTLEYFQSIAPRYVTIAQRQRLVMNSGDVQSKEGILHWMLLSLGSRILQHGGPSAMQNADCASEYYDTLDNAVRNGVLLTHEAAIIDKNIFLFIVRVCNLPQNSSNAPGSPLDTECKLFAYRALGWHLRELHTRDSLREQNPEADLRRYGMKPKM